MLQDKRNRRSFSRNIGNVWAGVKTAKKTWQTISSVNFFLPSQNSIYFKTVTVLLYVGVDKPTLSTLHIIIEVK